MLDLAVIDDAAAAEASLDPVRSRLLAELADPASASTLAAKVGLARQKVNYHLRALERHGLVELVEERRKGSMTERVMRATAASYVISPAVLAAVAPDPDRSPDQLSALWLLAVAARQVSELGELLGRAKRARRPLATFGIDTEVRFATAADRAAFAAELSTPSRGLSRSTTTSPPTEGASTACSSRCTRASPDLTRHPRRPEMPEFDCSREIVLPATPERVWEAVATNEGNAAWLFPNDPDPDAAQSLGSARIVSRSARRRATGSTRSSSTSPTAATERARCATCTAASSRPRASRPRTTASSSTPTSTCTRSASTWGTSTAGRPPTSATCPAGSRPRSPRPRPTASSACSRRSDSTRRSAKATPSG